MKKMLRKKKRRKQSYLKEIRLRGREQEMNKLKVWRTTTMKRRKRKLTQKVKMSPTRPVL